MAMPSKSALTYLHAARPSTQDAVQRRIVRLIFAFYWLLIFEGALRKWGLPQLEQVLFFIRVPVALVLYWIAFRYRRWPRMGAPMLGFYLFAAVATLLVPIQLIAGGYGPRYILLAGYGWMNYFFYVPLAFLIAEQFRLEDLQRLTRHAAWLVLASCPIVIMQFFSPGDSVINLGSGLDVANQFKNLGAALGFVRPTGFFTSTAGQAHFVASAAALLLAAFLRQRKDRFISPALLWPGLTAVAVMTVFSQNRGLFFMIGLIFFAAALAGLLTGRRRVMIRAGVWPIVLVAIVVTLWPLLFPTAFEVFVIRWASAQASEVHTFQLGVFGRAFYAFYAFIYHMSDTPITGYLLGLGGNAANQLQWVRMPQAAMQWHGYGAWVEDDWSRNVIELGPLLGVCFIVFRVALPAWLGLIAARATKYSDDVLPVILFGYVGIGLLYGQITGDGTINGFTWLFVGVCLAASRISRRTAAAAANLQFSPNVTV